VLDIQYQIVPLVLIQHDALFLDDALDQQRQLVLELLRRQPLEALQIDAIQNRLMHGLLQFLIRRSSQSRRATVTAIICMRQAFT